MEKYFKQVFDSKVDNAIAIEKFVSTRTGLTVVIAQVEGPVVNGFFCVATEAHDDDGLPHTLEHLVFMGSENYPYKGVLDLLANRCLASGTNAWTDTDHTCYTITNAGSEGFLIMLPVYLDHILYPTLKDSAYVTEVHHVNGDGDDAGIVYCEMQARENTGDSLSHLNMLRAMYPGRCGYKSETGGIMKNLRESTSHEKVKNYHKDFYRPDNLCVIITGEISPDEVFKALEPIENKILSKGHLSPFTRPWQSEVPPLVKSMEQTIEYPADEEDTGMVSIAWRGPMARNQYRVNAMHVLLEYLTDTSVSPLQKAFVELDDPYCSDVAYHMIENFEICFEVKFESVPCEKLDEIKENLFGVLKQISTGEMALDMSRLQDVIHRCVLEAQNNIEKRPHDTVSFYVIGDFLYGNDNVDLDLRLNQVKQFQQLQSESKQFWENLLKEYMISKPYVLTIGRPSNSLMEEMGTSEKQRVQKQRDKLGATGLQEKEELLKKAIELNDIPLPQEMVTKFPSPSTDSIHFHNVKTTSNFEQSQPDQTLGSLGAQFAVHDIITNFVKVYVLVNTANLPQELRKYLPLFCELLVESPVRRGDVLITYEQVVQELASDTLANGVVLGVLGGHRFECGVFGSLISMQLEVENKKYSKTLTWCKELLYHTEFTPDRIKVLAAKMSKDVTQMRRKGQRVASCIMKDMLYSKDSNIYNTNMLRQYKFLTDVIAVVDAGRAKAIVTDLNQLRAILFQPENMRIHMVACLDRLKAIFPDPVQLWMDFVPGTNSPKTAFTIKQASDYLLGINDGDLALISGIGSVESSFLVQSALCYKAFDHPDDPALQLLLQYLTQLEGPMWRQIRGLGLAYHFALSTRIESGQIQLTLARATHVVEAYIQAKEVIEKLLSNGIFNDMELQSAKSSLIFEIIGAEQTPKDAASQAMLCALKRISPEYKKKMIAAIPGITTTELLDVGKKYLVPLFNVQQSKVVVCCHPNKVEEICTSMKDLGRVIQPIPSLDESSLMKF